MGTTKFDPDKHHRRSFRLRGYDYAQAGAYFVTIVTQGRQCLFGEVVESEMRLNEYGRVVVECWNGLPGHYPHVGLDAFVVMPNHVHGVLELTRNVGAGLRPAPTSAKWRHSLSEIVRAFKAFSSRRINELRNMPGAPVWQRNYYEHIIRNEDDLYDIRQYIIYNPAKWAEDGENPVSVKRAIT